MNTNIAWFLPLWCSACTGIYYSIAGTRRFLGGFVPNALLRNVAGCAMKLKRFETKVPFNNETVWGNVGVLSHLRRIVQESDYNFWFADQTKWLRNMLQWRGCQVEQRIHCPVRLSSTPTSQMQLLWEMEPAGALLPCGHCSHSLES